MICAKHGQQSTFCKFCDAELIAQNESQMITQEELPPLPRSDIGGLYSNEAMHKYGKQCIATLKAENKRITAERDALKLQAQAWSMEAKAQLATVQAAYQVCTGSTGEPGDWNGAEPIRALAARVSYAQSQVETLKAELAQCRSDRQREHDARCTAAGSLEAAQSQAAAMAGLLERVLATCPGGYFNREWHGPLMDEIDAQLAAWRGKHEQA